MKTFLIVSAVLFLSVDVFSQGTLQGTVVDDNTEPLIGANIVLHGTDKGTIADRLGGFRLINVAAGSYQLDISFIGYATQTLSIEIRDKETTIVASELITGGVQLGDVLVTASQDRPVNTLSQVDIKFRPINTSQDILRMVPGLFIAQHAGGGKAEQIFLRGFDADHGTDINVEVDGMPVNMVSHAHGQGYADLHFLIPEIVGLVDFDKGPYFADKGDLNTAGYVAFQTKSKLDRNFFKLEGGSFGSGRAVAGINIPMNSEKSSAYVASEFYRSDGFFINNQRFTRFNIQSKFNTQLGEKTRFTASLSVFNSHWDASGQVPDRAIESGMINRYGSLDPTEGGGTGRFNAYLKSIHDLGNGSSLENQLYAIKYNFSLFSNFTFFLKDSVNGDQIHQQEDRWVYGYKGRYTHLSTFLGRTLKSEIGAGARYDVISNIALSHTFKRDFLNDIKRGDIHEANAHGFWSETLSITERLSINGAVRFDYFHFAYRDKLSAEQPSGVDKSIFSPKLNINYQASKNVNFFVRSGTGFHSNDARVVVAQSGRETLPRAYSMDVGADVKITPQLLVHAAIWRLDLDQEFVYVGDDGIVEPSGKSQREGVDFSIRYQLASWLFLDGDLNVTRPRAKGLPEGENYIPLAPTITSIGGLSFRNVNGFNGSLRYRYLGDRPANEDYSVVAKGYVIADALVAYSRPGYEIGASVENIFNREWKEAQFDTESRLRNETTPVSEIHFTPGTPLSFKVRFTKYF
ncbi:MAG: TonB-dependent receptor [Cyclobacteriaceae bacterium]|nr:TonB-dependent receptor [Cyclobacteriaceae bacterium]